MLIYTFAFSGFPLFIRALSWMFLWTAKPWQHRPVLRVTSGTGLMELWLSFALSRMCFLASFCGSAMTTWCCFSCLPAPHVTLRRSDTCHLEPVLAGKCQDFQIRWRQKWSSSPPWRGLRAFVSGWIAEWCSPLALGELTQNLSKISVCLCSYSLLDLWDDSKMLFGQGNALIITSGFH